MAATPQQPAAPLQTDSGAVGGQGMCQGTGLPLLLGDLGPVLITLWACFPAVKGKREKGELELDFSPSLPSSLEQRLKD